MQRCGAGIELRRFCPAIAERVSGTNHSCELRSDNTITCWGSNYYGQTDAPGHRVNEAFRCWRDLWNHNCSKLACGPQGSIMSCGPNRGTVLGVGYRAVTATDAPVGGSSVSLNRWKPAL